MTAKEVQSKITKAMQFLTKKYGCVPPAKHEGNKAFFEELGGDTVSMSSIPFTFNRKGIEDPKEIKVELKMTVKDYSTFPTKITNHFISLFIKDKQIRIHDNLNDCYIGTI